MGDVYGGWGTFYDFMHALHERSIVLVKTLPTPVLNALFFVDITDAA
jgi:hypothetical protein